MSIGINDPRASRMEMAHFASTVRKNSSRRWELRSNPDPRVSGATGQEKGMGRQQVDKVECGE